LNKILSQLIKLKLSYEKIRLIIKFKRQIKFDYLVILLN